MVADREIADAMARSFLGKLPVEVVDRLLAEGERNDYPAGITIYQEGAAPRTALVVSAAPAVSRAEDGTPDPVRAVSVISTGTVEIHPEHALGTSKPLYRLLLTSLRREP